MLARRGSDLDTVSAIWRARLVVVVVATSMISCVVRGQGLNVPGAVDLNPQNDLIDKLEDALGLSGILGDDDTPVQDRWYFWLIIALIIVFVVVCGYFTVRGFLRYRRVKKENQLKLLIPETPDVVYFDKETQTYIIDMSRRTGIPAKKIKDTAAKHALEDFGALPRGKSKDVRETIGTVDEVSAPDLVESVDDAVSKSGKENAL